MAWWRANTCLRCPITRTRSLFWQGLETKAKPLGNSSCGPKVKVEHLRRSGSWPKVKTEPLSRSGGSPVTKVKPLWKLETKLAV